MKCTPNHIRAAIAELEHAASHLDHTDACCTANTKDGVAIDPYDDAWDIQPDVCPCCLLDLALFNADDALKQLAETPAAEA